MKVPLFLCPLADFPALQQFRAPSLISIYGCAKDLEMVLKTPPRSAKAPDPMARARILAERMAKRLGNEDVGDVSIALALLTSGMVYQYADNAAKAHDLLAGIRRLEDQFVERAFTDDALH